MNVPFAELALTAGIIDARVFSILVSMAVFTTATVPILLTRSINWLRRRGELAADERDGVVTIGAEPVARHMAKLLAEETDMTMIDTNLEHVRAAGAVGLSVAKGNGIDDDLAIATKPIRPPLRRELKQENVQ